jgi:Holliday junction resolvase RusA-like endonuclease
MKNNSCNLGKPFSANQMYVPIARGKMIKSAKYRKWIEENSVHLKDMCGPQNYPVEIDVLILANHQWTMKNDPDNCLKPIMDLLVSNKILPDDTNQYVAKIQARVLYCPGEPMVRISYEEPDEVLATY